ncbi:LOW QUALITY PROTEIN: hypothetical protein HZS_5294 [Henneguya salminicola]|nr:LOW QUALITY PROTEIN: hypothetical protein HZS_5294 [Henneguya salminicola]
MYAIDTHLGYRHCINGAEDNHCEISSKYSILIELYCAVAIFVAEMIVLNQKHAFATQGTLENCAKSIPVRKI